MDLKKICRFLIFLSIWKRLLHLKLFWVLKWFIHSKNTCGYEKYLPIWKRVVDLKKHLLIWEIYIVNDPYRSPYLFFLATLFFDPQLIQTLSLKSIFDLHKEKNLPVVTIHFVILRFMFFYNKSVFLLTCVMFTQSCCYLKYHTCIFIGLKNIHQFLIYSWISNRFVELPLFCGLEKDLSALNCLMDLEKRLTDLKFDEDLKKFWRFLIIS